MSQQEAPSRELDDSAGRAEMPTVDRMLLEIITTLMLSAHAYLGESPERAADPPSAEIAIDVASVAFERVKERLSSDERLALVQMLTDIRLLYVRKRDA